MKTRPGQTIRVMASRGFVVFEAVVLLLLIGCVIAGALLAPRFVGGKSAWWLGAILGLLGFLLGVVAWCGLMALAIDGIPRLPKCRDGTCRGEDYKLHKFGEEFIWVCRHGGRYVRRGRRFVGVNDDGKDTPYLIWRPFRGWHADGPSNSELPKQDGPSTCSVCP